MSPPRALPCEKIHRFYSVPIFTRHAADGRKSPMDEIVLLPCAHARCADRRIPALHDIRRLYAHAGAGFAGADATGAGRPVVGQLFAGTHWRLDTRLGRTCRADDDQLAHHGIGHRIRKNFDLDHFRFRHHLLSLSAAQFFLLDDFHYADAARGSAHPADLQSGFGLGHARLLRRPDAAADRIGHRNIPV